MRTGMFYVAKTSVQVMDLVLSIFPIANSSLTLKPLK
jgi:hypothetical protein